MIRIPLVFLMLCCLLTACKEDKKTPPGEQMSKTENNPLNFVSHRVIDNAKSWWALSIGDVTNDGLQDAVYTYSNANGSYLAYRTGSKEGGLWKETIIAQKPPTGDTFAAGDLETGDMDGDGDLDIVAVKHTRERDDAGAEAQLFYYENPSWTPHLIGKAKGTVKDLSIADFDGDGRMDLAVLTFNEHNLRIHRQKEDGTFEKVVDITQKGLHEGMDVGDLDGDGDVDITATGFIFTNPGDNLRGEWTISVVDEKWHKQTGDWSANATKEFVADIDDDGKPEIFISHSERAGYPLSYYQRQANGTWKEYVIVKELPAAHTLQVFDMDLDGDLDVVTGINSARAAKLDPKVEHYEVMVMLNQGDGTWKRKLIETDGIYNGRVADFEGDGDYDIFRLPNQEATELFFIENQVR